MAFAIRFLTLIADGDFVGAEALVDVNSTGERFTQVFPPAGDFVYCHPDQVYNWSMQFVAADALGLRFDFDIPFADEEYRDRPMIARFSMRRLGTQLEVSLTGLVPS